MGDSRPIDCIWYGGGAAHLSLDPPSVRLADCRNRSDCVGGIVLVFDVFALRAAAHQRYRDHAAQFLLPVARRDTLDGTTRMGRFCAVWTVHGAGLLYLFCLARGSADCCRLG